MAVVPLHARIVRGCVVLSRSGMIAGALLIIAGESRRCHNQQGCERRETK
jgi:hypothetical protein